MLLRHALTETGRMVEVDEARGAGPVTCYLCGERVIARRPSGQIAHFAHQGRGGEAAGPREGEGDTHRAAKWRLAEGLFTLIGSDRTLRLGLSCRRCGGRTRVSWPLGAGAEVWVERALGPFRPDVLVRGSEARPLIFEVLDHNPCADDKLQWARREGHILLEVDATGLGDWTPSDTLRVAHSVNLARALCGRCRSGAPSGAVAPPPAAPSPPPFVPVSPPAGAPATTLAVPRRGRLNRADAERERRGALAAKRVLDAMDALEASGERIVFTVRCHCGGSRRVQVDPSTVLTSGPQGLEVRPVPGRAAFFWTIPGLEVEISAKQASWRPPAPLPADRLAPWDAGQCDTCDVSGDGPWRGARAASEPG